MSRVPVWVERKFSFDFPAGQYPNMCILGQFREARFRLFDRVETSQPERFNHSLVDPRLKKPMKLVDHLYFVAEHDDHHLAPIWELINK